MRRSTVICVLMISLFLSACAGKGATGAMEQVLSIRGEYTQADGCTAKAAVVADYGQRVYHYTVDVTVSGGETVLTVTAPEELAGITARISGTGGQLEYDGAVFETGPLSADGLTPLSAVAYLLECARSGFVDSCTAEVLGERETLRVLFRDPAVPAGQGQEATLWFDTATHALAQGEVSVDGRRVLLCQLEQFSLN